MYSCSFLKALVLAFFLALTPNHNNSVLAVDKSATPDSSFEGLVLRFKIGLNYFTDCSVDTLLKHCNEETAKNFECFRSLGECFTVAARAALRPGKEDPEPEPKPNDEL